MLTDLITAARQGDRSAFAALVAAHYDFIHAVAWKWTGNRDDADDVAQDVCIRLGAAIRGFRGESRLTTWLYTLTLNAVRDRARRQAAENRGLAAFSADPTSGADGGAPGRGDGADDGLEDLWTHVRALPGRQRDAVLLVYAEGLNHAEAADVLGCSEPTVSWHLHEARKRLKQMVGKSED